MQNFESLAMILIDKDFDSETFDMDTYYFAEDLLPKKKKKADENETTENIKDELKHLTQILLPPIVNKECGKKLMLVYVDIYGNEFKEEFKLK
jgi:site-specific DNA-methyltransferase (adenine-specific)/adenine-specific DNA-methyltransferase